MGCAIHSLEVSKHDSDVLWFLGVSTYETEIMSPTEVFGIPILRAGPLNLLFFGVLKISETPGGPGLQWHGEGPYSERQQLEQRLVDLDLRLHRENLEEIAETFKADPDSRASVGIGSPEASGHMCEASH